MKTKLQIRIESFSELLQNWGEDNEDEITIQSIETAHKFLNTVPEELLPFLDVFPMRDGGIQFELGEFKEIEIFNTIVTEIAYDHNYTIMNKVIYEL